MKKIQEKKFSKNADIRRAYAKKLHLSDSWAGRRLTADELAAALHISRAHAYRLIDAPDKLTQAQQELLEMKTLGAIPAFGPGWYITPDGLSAPNGFKFSPADLENYGLSQQLLALSHADNRKLTEQVQELLELVNQLKSRLSTPDHLRKWNNPRVIRYDFGKQKTGSEG